jgi:hypothetical protein
LQRNLSCERFHYFKTRFDRNTSYGIANYEGLKGNIKHDIIQEILKNGECKGPYDNERKSNTPIIVNNTFNHRKLIDQIMLSKYDDVVNFSTDQLNEMNIEADKVCVIAFNFKRRYLDNREPIICSLNYIKKLTPRRGTEQENDSA